MITLSCRLALAGTLIGFALLTPGAVVFQDDFESGMLGPAWSVSTTVDGRAAVTTSFEPDSGQFHLVLDDAVNDAQYSVAACTLRLNLSNKKNAVLTFKVKSLGDESNWPGVTYPTLTDPPTFDGVSISTDGGATWRFARALVDLAHTWVTQVIPLEYYLSSYDRPLGQDVRIRFSQYDNASAPLDGIAIDDVVVTAEEDQRATLECPARLVEGSGPYTGYVLLAFAPTSDLALDLATTPAGSLLVPAFVVVPAGQRQITFSFSVPDDGLVNLTRYVTLLASASNVTSFPFPIAILDDDMPVVTLHLPAQLTEGVFTNDNAVISLDRAPDVPFDLSLNASPYGELSYPYSITIPVGQTQAVFTVSAEDDGRIDGNVLITLTASSGGVPVATSQILTVDNETRSLSLVLPATAQEGSVATGMVSIAGTLLTNLNVSLTSSDVTELAVPAVATIVAGDTQAAFPLVAVDNTLSEGSRGVTINATANTFTGASQTVTIRDNEVASYRFGALSNIVNISGPLGISVSAADVEGNAISGFTGKVNLSVVLPDGTTLPLTPASVSWSGSIGWVGDVTFPTVNASPLRLRATDGDGVTSDSIPFDLMRKVDLVAAADLVWDSSRNRFYASVASDVDGTNANRVVVIDPASAKVTGSVQLAQDPGQLALTSGGESLYVALNANGSLVRMNPASMSVASTFPVGRDALYGTFYASDFCVVAGQPDLLVISRTGPGGYEHYGVAVYENGIARPAITQYHNGSRVIEPSADPNVFFGYDNYNTYGFRRLQLTASGITETDVNTALLHDYGADILADGDWVFSTSGVELDGAQMHRLGTFPVSGTLRPDPANHRVYFIEQQYPNWWGYYDKISAYDPVTFSNIRKLTMSSPVTSPTHLIRWGTNGLAFLTSSNVVLINSSQLVPNEPPANLVVAIEAAPNPAVVSAPLTYTLTVSNQGPASARNTILETLLSASQTIQSVISTNGTPNTSSNSISLRVSDLAPGATASLAITTLPQSAGMLVCAAKAISDPPDPEFADNSVTNFVSVGYQLGLDTVSRLRLAANNLIYDPTRNVLWASVPDSDPVFRRCVVSINPVTGVISEPIAIGGYPKEQCMALSTNGRYLYLGLTESAEVHRIDLAAGNPSVRIGLNLSQSGGPYYAQDIEPLAGDGTSFLVATSYGIGAFDGDVPRTNYVTTFAYHLEKTGTPEIFLAASYDRLDRLSVTASGVEAIEWASGLMFGYRDIRAEGNLILAGSGHLFNNGDLTLRANFGIMGAPCLDLSNHRAYLVSGNTLSGFDTETLLQTGSFSLPDYWAQTCVRWGLDGFAILGNDGMLYVLRWSATIPPGTDANADGIPDAWEAAYFGTLDVDPAEDDDGDGLRNFQEYLFGTSPLQADANPMQVSATSAEGQTALRLVFPRRAGLSPRPYSFVTSANLNQWEDAQGVSETVLSTWTADSVQMESVEANIPFPSGPTGFVRLQWRPR